MNADLIVKDLVTTVDKRELTATLRVWRAESKDRVEVDLINDLLELLDSGDLDG